ncbi:MAG: hypothetical protein ACRDJ1_07870 [Actinomycetota bacterium]
MRRLLVVPMLVVAMLAGFVPARSAVPTIYLVGASAKDISPIGWGTINLGGFGFGDGTSPVSNALGAGHKGEFKGHHIAARAIVVQDPGTGVAIAMATVETQGMFAAYENDPDAGLIAIAERVAADIPALPASNILISNDHTHSGPDAIGVWGFIPHDYLAHIANQIVAAIEEAYATRRSATINAGADDVPDLIYNMACTEALNQDPESNFPNNVCDPFEEGKDSWLRALQARDATTGAVITTMVSYAAHATLGGGDGVHGDWPQFLSDVLTNAYGGVGIAFQGANGRTQPCRPRCSFTDSSKPGYEIADRRTAYTTMLMYHVGRALEGAPAVTGPVAAAKTFIRHEVENPVLVALLVRGEAVGAPIQRSRKAPWLVGNTLTTVVSAFRIGDLLFNGSPGEPYPNIAAGVSEFTNVPPTRHWTFALTDDQLGYLIAPAEGYPAIAAQVAVNDNAIFNVSPTIGDHVMCAQIRLSREIGFAYDRLVPEPRCLIWDAVDSVTARLPR